METILWIIIGILAVIGAAAIVVAVVFYNKSIDTVREYNSKLTNKKIELNQLQVDYTDLNSNYTHLYGELHAANTEIETLQQVVEAKDTEIEKLQAKIKAQTAEKKATTKAKKVAKVDIVTPEVIEAVVEPVKPKKIANSKKSTATKTVKKNTKKRD